MQNDFFGITVVTVTRNRPELLQRAILSVQRQKFDGMFHHFIAIDNCQRTKEFLDKIMNETPNLSYIFFERSKSDKSGPAILAKLRNEVALYIKTEWICFLDDDNEYEDTHLQQIKEKALISDAQAIHSYRKLFHSDGRPFIEEYWPWVRDKKKAKEKYEYMIKCGYLKRGSNVVYDGLEWGTIDTNTWAIKTKTLLENKMSTNFSLEEWKENKAEDDKLLSKCIENNVKIDCTNNATVRYYLGGYSTDFSENPSRSERWLPPEE